MGHLYNNEALEDFRSDCLYRRLLSSIHNKNGAARPHGEDESINSPHTRGASSNKVF
jgi:hypothetical protein